VFRAFSLAVYAFARGAQAVVPIASIEQARALKAAHPNWLLAGERHARPLPGFDCGNSPTELERLDLCGRTLIHTTHSGTQGLTSASGEEVLTGALVNAAAVARYILSRSPPEVTLVRMGHEARERCAEDDLCAELIARRLHEADPHAGPGLDAVRRRLRGAAGAQKFFDPACDWAPEGDFDRCTHLDAFDVVLRRELDGPLQVLRQVTGE
jgi:2-phosphosulfolactate phosphatase